MIVNGTRVRFVFHGNRFRNFAERVGRKGARVAKEVLSRTHFPPESRPGGVPHRRTGYLAESFRVRRTKHGATVETTVNYARFLEMGTKKMAPRPFRKIIIDKTRRAAKRIRPGRLIGLSSRV